MGKIPKAVRIVRARMGGFAVAAKHDPREYTRPARAAMWQKFLDQVDPNRELPEDERVRRADAARSLHFAGLQLKSIQARRRRAVEPDEDEVAS